MDDRQANILQSFYESPSYYVEGLEESSKMLVLRYMSRRNYQDSTFLNHLLEANDDIIDVLSLDQALDHNTRAAPAPEKIHFIFHFAFCGSTLLSRCLDAPGKTMVYKEPYLIHQISFYKRFPEHFGLPWTQVLDFGLSSLQRTYAPTEVPVVKLTDSCSNLVEPCLARHPASKGIVLYNTLDTFMLAALKSDQRRRFIRGMYARAVDDLKSAGILFSQPPDSLSDAATAGLVWFSLMHRYQMLLRDSKIPLKSLYMDQFINDPINTLERVNAYFDTQLSQQQIEQTVTSGAFRKNAKIPDQTFDSATYKSRQAYFRSSFEEEIVEGKALLEPLKQEHPFEDHLVHLDHLPAALF